MCFLNGQFHFSQPHQHQNSLTAQTLGGGAAVILRKLLFFNELITSLMFGVVMKFDEIESFSVVKSIVLFDRLSSRYLCQMWVSNCFLKKWLISFAIFENIYPSLSKFIEFFSIFVHIFKSFD